ncbi:Ras-responsive element-binding protein 1 like protein [Argiope bruennichi]|uniref:Ras-responsive element-binding protein 1 like protein n=1 Tax=Argiope bruennichi TaxID=94029 RepID=A0A8T0EYN2_ARGBR|nr:Ras-responsive element-binding protein 1 like protein [Argiope bruennichi]
MVPPPPAYLLRSHAQDSGRKSMQQATDKTKDTVDKMRDENVQSRESLFGTELEKDCQTKETELSESNSEAKVEIPMEQESSGEMEACSSTPSEFNSPAAVENLIKFQTPAGKSNEIMDKEKNPEEEIISCPKCGQIFERRTQLTEHLKTYSTDQATCPICNKVLNSSNSRDRHLLTHSKERPYPCSLCPLTFTTNGNMHRHYKKHFLKGEDEDFEEETPEFLSTMSNEKEMYRRKNYFKSLGLRRKSSILQSKVNKGKFVKLPEKRKRPIICEEGKIAKIPRVTTQTNGNVRRKKAKKNIDIGSSNTSRSSVQFNSDCLPNSAPTDVQDLAGITDIISNVQPKIAAENQTEIDVSSAEQIIKHSLQQSYSCQNCKYTAKDKNSLKRHSQIHKRNGKFQCGFCSLTFTNKANGQRHVRDKHGLQDRESISERLVFLKENTNSSDDETFTCKYCPSVFDNEQALQHHLRSNECKMKPYFCAICDIGSSTKNNCFRHIENKHPEIFTNEMTSEEKNRVKELNMRQTIYISPHQDEDNKSKEIEAAEGLCRLSENRQDGTFMEAVCIAEELYDLSCSRMADVQVPSMATERHPPMAAGKNLTMADGSSSSTTAECSSIEEDPLLTFETFSSLVTERDLAMLSRKPSTVKKINEFLEDKPLDLSLNPLDLSLKSFKASDSPDLLESNLDSSHANESQMVVSETHGLSQSARNFSKSNNNFQKQKNALPKQNSKHFRCRYCEKTFSTNSNLQRHLANLHKQSSIIHLEPSHNPIRRDLLREFSINSSVKHYGDSHIKNSRSSLLTNSKSYASYDRGNGSDTENDLASIPSIQSTVNQVIQITHPCTSTVYSFISHINRKLSSSDLQSIDSSFPSWNQRKKQPRVVPRSPTETACSPISVSQRVATASMDRLIDDGSVSGSPAPNPGNNLSADDMSKSFQDHNFNARLVETAESSKDTDLICRYCSSQFSSNEHVKSHIKELHYLEHNNTLEVPDEKVRWKKERVSKLRQ